MPTWLTAEQAEPLTLWLENAILDERRGGVAERAGPGRVRMAFL